MGEGGLVDDLIEPFIPTPIPSERESGVCESPGVYIESSYKANSEVTGHLTFEETIK